MKIKKGTLFLVRDPRKGKYIGKALRDFDTETEEFYPVTPVETVFGMVNTWEPGDEIPCRKGIAEIKIMEDIKCRR